MGEGDAEIALARAVRNSYTCNHLGRSVTHHNAHGYGAGNVVDIAIARKRRGGFTAVAAMLDADTDWNEPVKKRAQKAGIVVICSDPCLEASLLSVVGIEVVGNQQACKETFRERFGADAHTDGLIARNFDADVLNAARNRVRFVDELLAAIGV